LQLLFNLGLRSSSKLFFLLTAPLCAVEYTQLQCWLLNSEGLCKKLEDLLQYTESWLIFVFQSRNWFLFCTVCLLGTILIFVAICSFKT
jgi:hypothetical protein